MYLISKLGFVSEEIVFSVCVGVFDMLCIIPQDEVEEYGIPYVCSIIEEDLDDMEIERWNIFWEYFNRQWIPILDSWNICDYDGKYKELMNRTNNGLESYNKRFNGFFEKKPSLLECFEVVEAESRYQAQF